MSAPTRLPTPALLALAALLAGCVDFVDPAGLRLAENTRINVQLTLTDAPFTLCAGGGTDAPVQAGQPIATLCVEATVDPGRDKVGERVRLADDTIVVMGVRMAPVLGNDSIRVYQGGFRIPFAQLSDTALTVTFPRIEGVTLPITGIRWFAAAPLGPDTIRRAPDEDVQLRLALPTRASNPLPRFESWQASVSGTTAAAAYNGETGPRARYDFPAEVLAGLGGDRHPAAFRWTRSYSFSLAEQRVQASIFFTEQLGWTILTVRPPPPAVPGA